MMKKVLIVFTYIMLSFWLLKFFFYNNSWRLLFHEMMQRNDYIVSKLFFSAMGVLCAGAIIIAFVSFEIVLRWDLRIINTNISVRTVLLLNKSFKLVASCFLIVIILTCVDILSDFKFDREDIWRGDITVAHSFGGIDGKNYTGSLEAFLYNYKMGHRTFEVDLQLTSDNELVSTHDWEAAEDLQGSFSTEVPDLEEFLSKPILDKYTPLSLANILTIMDEHKDMYIVTDSKDMAWDDVEKQINNILITAKKTGTESVLDRFVIQVYSPEHYEMVNKLYSFKSYIFTLYMYWHDDDLKKFRKICEWCYSKNIHYITMWNYKYSPEVAQIAKDYNIEVFVHTENDVNQAKQFLARGAKGIYTDFIIPSQLTED